MKTLFVDDNPIFSEEKKRRENSLKFTLREKECAQQIIEGRSPGQIAKVLNLSKCTVYFYLNSVSRKFGQFLNKPQQSLRGESL